MPPNYRDQGTQTESDTTLQSNGSARSETRCIQPPKELPFAEYNLPIELVEEILLAVPMKDLLLAQRVSKSWKGFIDWSTPCQRKLFFTAGVPPPPQGRGHEFEEHFEHEFEGGANWWPCCTGDLVEYNPLLIQQTEQWVPRHYTCIKPKHLALHPESSCMRMRLVSNPLRWMSFWITDSCEHSEHSQQRLTGACLYGNIIQHVKGNLISTLECMVHDYSEPWGYLTSYGIEWLECCDEDEDEPATGKWEEF